MVALVLTLLCPPLCPGAVTIDIPAYQDPLGAWINAFPPERMCVGPPLDPATRACPEVASQLAEDAATMAAFTKELVVCGGEKIFSWSGAWNLGLAALTYALPMAAPYTAPVVLGNAQKESILCVWRSLVNVSDLDEESKKLAYEIVDTPVQVLDVIQNGAKLRELLSRSKNLAALMHLLELGSSTAEAVEGAPVPEAEEHNLWAEPVAKLQATLEAAVPAAQACDFARAQEVLDQAEGLVEEYRALILAKSAQFRQAEFEANCLVKTLKENELNEISDLGFELRAQDRLTGFANGWYGAVNFWSQGEVSGVGRLARLLEWLEDFKGLVDAWQSSPVPGQVDRLVKEALDRRNAYIEAMRQAKAAMAAGDTKGACGHVRQAFALYGGESESCRPALLAGGEGPLDSPRDLAGQLITAHGAQDNQAAELLRQARQALEGGNCDPARGDSLAGAALGVLATMGWYDETGGTCETPGSRLAEATALKADAAAKLKARAGINALLAEGQCLAGDLCLYETALTGPREYLALLDAARAGCLENQARAQYQAIAQLQNQTSAWAEGVARQVKELISQAGALVSPLADPPGCDVMGARDKLAQARSLFASIACPGATFTAQSQTWTRTEAVNDQMASAEQAIEERLTALTTAEKEYRSLYNDLVALTDDSCRFKEAVNPAKLARLDSLGAALCDSARAQADRAMLAEAVSGMEQYMASDLADFKQALAEVNQEPACDRAEDLIREKTQAVSYVTDCPASDSTREFQAVIEQMSQALRKKSEDARTSAQRVLAQVRPAAELCQGSLPQAMQALTDMEREAPDSCLDPETAAALKQYRSMIEEHDKALAAINGLLPQVSAALNAPNCDFSNFDRLLAQAREMLARSEPCPRNQESFRAAATSLDRMASNRDSVVQEVAWADKKLALALAAAQHDWSRTTYNDLQAVVSGIAASGRSGCYPQMGAAQSLVAQGPPQETSPQLPDSDGIILLEEEATPIP